MKRQKTTFFAAILDLVLNCAAFIYIGTWIPFGDFTLPSVGITPGRLVALGISILFARRIPVILLLYKFVPRIRDVKDALFCGHFGPMGVGAVFISTLALTQLPSARDPPQDQIDILVLAIRPIVSFMVIVSLLIHGLSIPLSRVGLKVHHRALSITQTWNSLMPSIPYTLPVLPQYTEESDRVIRRMSVISAGNAESIIGLSQTSLPEVDDHPVMSDPASSPLSVDASAPKRPESVESVRRDREPAPEMVEFNE